MNSLRRTYLFGTFRLDTTRRILYAGSVPTPIPERLFNLLFELIKSNGNIATKEALSESIWGDEGVTDSNLTQHVYLLRLLLGERKGERKYIVTVPGEGYRFVAPVREAPESEDEMVENAIRSGSRFADEDINIFRWYCHGSYLLDLRTAQSLRHSMEAFEQALSLDANHTPSLVGLSRAHALLAEYWHTEPNAAFASARSAIRRALQLEPYSSMAHAVQSELLLFADWDWPGAKKEIVTSIQMNPQSPFAHVTAAWLYLLRADFQKAMMEVKQALIIEPSSLPSRLSLARIFIHSGRYDQAITNLTNLLSTDPRYYLTRRYLAVALLLKGEPLAAIREAQIGDSEPAEDPSFRLPLLGRAYAEAGDPETATAIYENLCNRSESEFVTAWNLAIVAYGLGRLEETMEHLRLGMKQREPSMLFLRTIPWFERLEHLPEFKRMLHEIGP